MMIRLMPPLVVLLALATVSVPALSAWQIETPRLREWTDSRSGATAAWLLVGDQLASGWVPGMAAVCLPGRGPQLRVYFGAFPGVHHPVQFAVRQPDGAVQRHGSVLRAGPESGFHDPLVVDRAAVLRLAAAAFQRGSLVSNGYNSFFNDASAAQNRQVLLFVQSCR